MDDAKILVYQYSIKRGGRKNTKSCVGHDVQVHLWAELYCLHCSWLMTVEPQVDVAYTHDTVHMEASTSFLS